MKRSRLRKGNFRCDNLIMERIKMCWHELGSEKILQMRSSGMGSLRYKLRVMP